MSIRALSEATYILPDDVMAALKSMQVLASTGVSDAAAAAAMINKAKIRAWVAEKGISLEPAVEQQGFVSL